MQKERIRILAVDDNQNNLIVLETILEELHYEIVKANSGEMALWMTLHQDFSLILLDVNMPGIDGFETARMLKSNQKTQHIPIIFITAHKKDFRDSLKGMSLGAVDYICKPIEPEELKEKIRMVVSIPKSANLIKTYGYHVY